MNLAPLEIWSRSATACYYPKKENIMLPVLEHHEDNLIKLYPQKVKKNLIKLVMPTNFPKK